MASIKPETLTDVGAPLLPPSGGGESTAAEMRVKLRSLLNRARGAEPPPPLPPPLAEVDNRVSTDARWGLASPREPGGLPPRYQGSARVDHARHHDHRHEDPPYYDDRDPHYRPHEEEDKYSRDREDGTSAHYRFDPHDTHADPQMYGHYNNSEPYHDRRDAPMRSHQPTLRARYGDDYPHRGADVGGGLLPTPGQTCTCPTHGPQWSAPVAPPPMYQSERPAPVLGDSDRHNAVIYGDHRSLSPSPRLHDHHHTHYHHSTPYPIVIPPGTHSRSSSRGSAATADSPNDRRPPFDPDYRDDPRSAHYYKRSSAYGDEDEMNDDDYRHARLRVAVKNESDDADDDLRSLLTPKANSHHKSTKRSAPPSPTASASSSATGNLTNRKRTKIPTPPAAPPLSNPVATLAEYEDGELFSDFSHMAHVLIPANASAALLERRGTFIQAIAKQSRCTLSVRDRFEDVQGDADELRDELADMRLLRIYGRPSGICLALRLTIERVREFRAQKRDPYYAPMTSELMMPLPDASVTRATVQWMGIRGVSMDTTETEDDTLVLTPLSGDSEDAVQLRWLVKTDQVGCMMGHKGVILAGIRRDTGATIHVAETAEMGPGTSERAVSIEGNRESVLAAHAAIQARAGGRIEPQGGLASKMGQYFAIPYHTAGFLIGQRGSRVRAITAKTGARLQIPSQLGLPLGSVNRIVHIQGTRKQIDHAVRVMSAKLRDYLAGDADLDDADEDAEEKAERREEYDVEGVEGEDSEDEDNNEEDDDPVTIRALVTTRAAARLLDSRGRLVREIMRKSGSYLRFLKGAPRNRNASTGDKSRVCLLSGDMPCMLRALRLLLQVEASDAQSKPKSMARNVPRVGKRKRVDEEGKQDEEEQEEQPQLDENHELPTKRSRTGRSPGASLNARSSHRSLPNDVRRSNGNAVARRGARGAQRRVQVVGGSSRSQRPVALAVRKS